MSIKENRGVENYQPYKASHTRTLNAQAKIMNALFKKQPQGLDDLCQNAGISKGTFYRNRLVLINEGIIKQTERSYSLSNYTEKESLWNRLKQKLLDAGAPLIDLKIEKFELGEQDPVTNAHAIYVKVLPVQGIMILRGAKELEAAASLQVPHEYLGFLLTQGAVYERGRFSWRGNQYEIQEVEEVIDGYEFGYNIAKLVYQYHLSLPLERRN